MTTQTIAFALFIIASFAFMRFSLMTFSTAVIYAGEAANGRGRAVNTQKSNLIAAIAFTYIMGYLFVPF